eukprot:CAMPEP_0181336066 /NCGR_PEP_ID=MMETSP1101-20121128/27204_1 /TAXON_ID=46948 /ORGANISM="Rhodomonas abbreviata, Strain Caron Lab Isolate" /LENGTH=44 /DNA_ID= /DNA_START= /DNA_END= /DNA_ORIENTATION=
MSFDSECHRSRQVWATSTVHCSGPTLSSIVFSNTWPMTVMCCLR